jgi:predicted DNA-binding transcriptional regulator YafY
MLETSARLLRLLSLLQTPRDWTGTELAERLGVSARTVRNDVGKLRELGYPVLATRGPTGGYRLGAGAADRGGRRHRGQLTVPACGR